MADEEELAPGWDAITEEFDRVYPGQTKPLHYAAIVPYMLGGDDPLNGISIYDGGDFWHFVSYGLTELYDKESEDKEDALFNLLYISALITINVGIFNLLPIPGLDGSRILRKTRSTSGLRAAPPMMNSCTRPPKACSMPSFTFL